MDQPGTSKWFNRFPHVVQNASGTDAPPYAVLQITGAAAVSADEVYTVTQPNGATKAKYLLNGPQAIAAGGYGAATDVYPATAAGTGATSGAEWGPVAGSWTLSPNGKGFLILGGE